MNNLIQNITIENFKSIKKLEMKNCARINLIIGKPNVGKSNIIEALSVFSLTHLEWKTNRLLTNTIRIEELSHIFYDGDSSKPSRIEIGIEEAILDYQRGIGLEINISNNQGKRRHMAIPTLLKRKGVDIATNSIGLAISENKEFEIEEQEIDDPEFFSIVKRYIFKDGAGSKGYNYDKLLLPPFGENLYDILLVETKLRKEIESLFLKYGLKLAQDIPSKSLKIFKDSGTDVVILPYTAMADTLQRVIFFKTAIASNANSVLLFEEPEAHAFPSYISKITNEVIDSESNQFFITTHSPYVLNDFLENRELDLAIYIVNYKNHETIIKRLTNEEQDKVYEYGINLFFNSEYFDE